MTLQTQNKLHLESPEKACSNPECPYTNPQPIEMFSQYRVKGRLKRESRCRPCDRARKLASYHRHKSCQNQSRVDSCGEVTYMSPIGEEPYAIIPLYGKYGTGKVALVSLCDVERIRPYRWYVNAQGYVMTFIPKGQSFVRELMHRLILRLTAGDGLFGDHKHGDKLDNRRSQIRPATPSENVQNRRPQKLYKSIYKGVSVDSGNSEKWRVTIRVDGIRHYLGTYKSQEAAATVYDACARFHFGEFAVCNFNGTEKRSAQEQQAIYKATEKSYLTSRYRGVYWDRKSTSWRAAFRIAQERFNLGRYKLEADAARAYDSCAKYILGECAKTNFVDSCPHSPTVICAQSRQKLYEQGERTSPYECVSPDKGKWAAAVTLSGKRKHLGRFDSSHDAAQACDEAWAAHGLPRMNFPQPSAQ